MVLTTPAVVEESLPASVGKPLGIELVHSNPTLLIQAVVDDLVNRGLLCRNGSQVHLASYTMRLPMLEFRAIVVMALLFR